MADAPSRRQLLTGRREDPPTFPELQGVRYEPAPLPEFVEVPNPRTGTKRRVPLAEHQQVIQHSPTELLTQIAATPYTGAQRIGRGIDRLPFQAPMEGVAMEEQPASSWNPRELAGGTADILAGGMEAGTLAVPGAIAKAPLQVGAGLLGGGAAMGGIQHIGRELGIPQEYVDLAAEMGGLAAGITAGHAVDSPRLRAEALRLYHDQSGEVRLPGRRGGKKAADPVDPIANEVRTLFPRLDAYSKPTSPISAATIRRRMETVDLSPATRVRLAEVADEIGTRRLTAPALHAHVAGEAYTPPRVIRKVKAPVEGGAKQRPGAPLGITTARQERGLRESYMRDMETGVGGRDWYHDAGKSILFHANDNPARARLLAGDLAITSPATAVSGNTGMGIKGYNQATAGVPVVAGRFPTAMGKNIAALHAGGEGSLGLKRDPFAMNLALGGGFAEAPASSGFRELEIAPGQFLHIPEEAPAVKPRAVHDIWDAEAHGYANADGSPMRTGFGPAQHRFMDKQQDKILATSNQRALAGHTNWDELRSQAATWTGRKIGTGEVDPAEAAKSFADHMGENYAQGSREFLPGETTGHLPELHQRDQGMEEYRQLLHDIMVREGGIYDPQMRDQIAAGYGGLVGRSFPGAGLYEGTISPGMQTQVLTGSLNVPDGPTGARMLDEGSRRIMDASEATFAIGAGQDAYAWSRLLPAGTGEARGLVDVTLPGGTITPQQMERLAFLFPNIGDMAVISTPDGVRLGLMDPTTMKTIIRVLGGKPKAAGAGLETGRGSNFVTNNWRELGGVGSNYLDPIRRLGGAEAFDVAQPAHFDRLRKADELFRRETNGRFTLSPMLDEVRGAAANEGFGGLERLARKYGIPVALLTLGLQTLQEETPH
jgi:hypothetical protein